MIKLDVTDNLATLSLSPGDVDASTLSVDYLVEYLHESGVSCGILDDEITHVVQQVKNLQRAVEGVVVARQIEPRTGQPAAIKHALSNDQIAAAGDTIAELGEAVAAVDGKTILGAVIKTPATPETVLSAGANTDLVGGIKLKATIYGKVKCNDTETSVEPLIQVEDDGLTAFMDIHPKSSTGMSITPEMVQKSLQAAGIVYGVDDEKIRAAMEQALETDSALLKEVVAEGKPAVRGTDARLEHFVETEQAIGEKREDGSMDFHERGAIRNVKSGVKICRRIPPTNGRAQVDVYGISDFAKPGEDIEFVAGENVEQRGEEFCAMIDGAVMIRDNIVTVSDVYSVPGDIDLKTGNLHHDKGSVHISGIVRSGFEVYAATHIMVGTLVEDATLESEGDVEINGGVIHANDGSIRATGNVTAKFAQNARISAGGDITINGAAMNCDLYASSRVIVAGHKARLVGGVARASGGFMIQQLGSEAGVQTRVEIDLDRQAIEALELKIKRIEEAIAAGEAKETDLERPLEKLRALTDTSGQIATIDVNGSVYPGVIVTIYGTQRTFSEENRRCRISLDENHEIDIRPLF